jgi:hypothetical protein
LLGIFFDIRPLGAALEYVCGYVEKVCENRNSAVFAALLAAAIALYGA